MLQRPSRFRTILRGLGCAAAIAVLASPVGAADPAADTKSAFSAAQRNELKQLIHDYIVANPEVINEAALALQAKDEAAQKEKQTAALTAHRQDLMASAEGTVIGNPKGDVTVVEFFDYNCGHCKNIFPSVMQTLKEDSKLRLVLKEFPILAPSSVTASKAALAAVKQNKYLELHVALLGYKGALSDKSIMDLAKGAGLDITRLQADMKSPELDKVIAHNNDLASALQVDGTPTLIIGNNLVPGEIPKDKLKEMIAAARAKS